MFKKRISFDINTSLLLLNGYWLIIHKEVISYWMLTAHYRYLPLTMTPFVPLIGSCLRHAYHTFSTVNARWIVNSFTGNTWIFFIFILFNSMEYIILRSYWPLRFWWYSPARNDINNLFQRPWRYFDSFLMLHYILSPFSDITCNLIS